MGFRRSRTPDCRLIPYHDTGLTFDGARELRNQIVSFVSGICGPRQNGVTEKQILERFRSTDPAFVRRHLSDLCVEGRVRICRRSLSSTRRHNGGYLYELGADPTTDCTA